jgi:Tfp pilus assembly protein PilO
MAGIIGIWKNLSVREKTMIGLAVGIAVVYLAVNFLLDPFFESYEEKKEQLVSRGELLNRYEHLIGTADRTRDKLERIATIESSINKGLLQGSNPDLANAELQGIAREIADKAEISFTRITPNKIIEENGFVLISLRLPFNGTIKQLVTFLHEVESSPYLLSVPSLSIRAQRRDMDVLRIEVEITGYIRIPQENDIDSDGLDLARF